MRTSWIALALVIGISVAQTLPAVYYTIWFILNSNPPGRVNATSSLCSVSADGGNFRVLYNSSLGFGGPLAFDGTHLFAVEGTSQISRFTTAIPPVRSSVLSSPVQGAAISCLGIGRDPNNNNNQMLLFTVENNNNNNNNNNNTQQQGGGTLYRSSLDGQSIRALVSYSGGPCASLTQTSNTVLFSTASGAVFSANLNFPFSANSGNNTVTAANATSVVVNATAGIAAVPSASALLFSSGNFNSLFSQPLSTVLNTTQPVLAGNNTLFLRPPSNSTSTLITINGALVVASNAGVLMYFAYSTQTSNQQLSRTILQSVGGTILGMATDTMSFVMPCVLLIVLAMCL